ncbi:MAG TPA: pyrroline-5-carboxylate reductase [Candidatus Avidehalobacter gallistercoris]|uniref:Pyrroline-5-carboxylate reductase n=1 Tax=Candidatus Avidehalobacter gallistercoris TaxID=2840694 RepID=A0A9D1HIJ6_9FIRM|nr:pyrroline-5-carboxylate reductase [Candidatus Avidehalobacter gallistercoris]
MAENKLVFLGGGNMAAAIGRGLVAKHTPFDLGFYDIHQEKAEKLAAELHAKSFASLEEAVKAADMLLLAVKPQAMSGLLADVAGFIRPGQMVLTIAAGLPLAYYETKLPNVPLVRAMPNTSAQVLAAITGLMAGSLADEKHKKLAGQVFAAVGDTVWIEEKDIHALTAISGSGPAYFYYFTEALARAGEKLGLDAKTAAKLARQTAVGSGQMLAESQASPAELRVQVTSKGGTTAAALSAFGDALPNLVEMACMACAGRSAEMAEEMSD